MMRSCIAEPTFRWSKPLIVTAAASNDCSSSCKSVLIDLHAVTTALVHDIQPPGMVAARACAAPSGATPFSNSHTLLLSSRDSRRCSSTNSVEDVCWMEPPSSDDEPLRDEQTAQIG